MLKLVFLLEEESARAMLEGLLPRILPDGVAHQCVPHRGKSDLANSLPRKLRAWREPGRNRSRSFQVFVEGLRRITPAAVAAKRDIPTKRGRYV